VAGQKKGAIVRVVQHHQGGVLVQPPREYLIVVTAVIVIAAPIVTALLLKVGVMGQAELVVDEAATNLDGATWTVEQPHESSVVVLVAQLPRDESSCMKILSHERANTAQLPKCVSVAVPK
jgi:hypothetical protein